MVILNELDLLFEFVKFVEDTGDLPYDILLFLFTIFNVTQSLLIEVVLQEQLFYLLELIL